MSSRRSAFRLKQTQKPLFSAVELWELCRDVDEGSLLHGWPPACHMGLFSRSLVLRSTGSSIGLPGLRPGSSLPLPSCESLVSYLG